VRVAALALLDRRVDPRLDEVQARLVVELARGPRSAAAGETSATTVTMPASDSMRATLATRRACSWRSAAEKPRSPERPWRTFSPSSR
jgi:hypothetical protein